MKYFVLSAMLWGLVSCGNSNPKATDTPSPAPQTETVAKANLEEVTLRIDGLTCAQFLSIKPNFPKHPLSLS